MDVEYVQCKGGAAGAVAADGYVPRLVRDDIHGGGANHTVSIEPEFVAGAQGGIKSLMPHNDSEERCLWLTMMLLSACDQCLLNQVNCSSGVLASGLSWSAAISAFYLWEGSVEGKVNHELDGEEAGVEADLEPNQEVTVFVLADSGEVPPPPEFDLDGAQGEDGARADEDAEHT